MLGGQFFLLYLIDRAVAALSGVKLCTTIWLHIEAPLFHSNHTNTTKALHSSWPSPDVSLPPKWPLYLKFLSRVPFGNQRLCWSHYRSYCSTARSLRGQHAMRRTRRGGTTQGRVRRCRSGVQRGVRVGTRVQKGAWAGCTLASMAGISICFEKDFVDKILTNRARLYYSPRARGMETELKTRGLSFIRGWFCIFVCCISSVHNNRID